MKILSFDIGIKNLAYALIEHERSDITFNLNKWDIINLCTNIPPCSLCKKQAKFTKNNENFCKTHTKSCEYKIPITNTKNLHKMNIKNLQELANEYAISYNKNILKKELINQLLDYMNNKCFDIIETPNANNVNLINIGITLKLELNKIFTDDDLKNIDLILLENQISPIANRMKTIQGMIAQYFIDRGNYNIEFISASNKLKLFNNEKNTSYNDRKNLSIKYTSDILFDKNLMINLDFFNKHNKKDDLADSLLQGIYYLNYYNNLQL